MTWMYSGASFCGACLLFLVQPMCAKMLLPHLGGTPAVWNTCMVFFQAGLLGGYAYAHYLPDWLGTRRHAVLHLVLCGLACFTLPIHFPASIDPNWHPILWLLAILTLHAGLPFVLLASCGPLLQRWFVSRNWASPRDPYFLYAASNLGSFLALGLFPAVIEPAYSLSVQSELWTIAFVVLIVLLAICVPWKAAASHTAATSSTAPPGRWEKARWIVLAMIPSSLLLSVTTHATTNIAAIPLLWLVPMAIYLLTFVLVFASRALIPQAGLIRWLPLMVVVLAVVTLSEATEPLLVVLGIHLLGLFWLAMLSHGELARSRPAADQLTSFYLCLAVGGVLGGIFNALIAPLVFPGLAEYPLMIVLACYFGRSDAQKPARDDLLWAAGLGAVTLLVVLVLQSAAIALAPGAISVAAMFGVPLLVCYASQASAARFALSLGAVLLASWFYHGVHGQASYTLRSYYGIHRVTEIDGFRCLVHGNTIHGQQNLTGDQRMPLAYYSEQGPIGDVFRAYQGDGRFKQVGLIGLGTGTLASYCKPGQEWTFFEIDPGVKHIAETRFTYLREAAGTIRIELGDGRLMLQQSPKRFGIIVIDAFGSDAIPVHLLTREALGIYFEHLQPGGALAFHISNNYVDLEPVLAALAWESAQACYVRDDRVISREAHQQGIRLSVWLVLARTQDDLAPLLTRSSDWRAAKTRAGVRAWTDASSNLLQVFRWGKGE